MQSAQDSDLRVVCTCDGSRAILVIRAEGIERMSMRDVYAVPVAVRGAPTDSESRIVVVFSVEFIEDSGIEVHTPSGGLSTAL